MLENESVRADLASENDQNAADATLLLASNKADAVSTHRWLSPPLIQSYVCFSLDTALGFAMGCTGTIIPLLAQNTGSSLDETGLIFTARGVGWIAGSMVAGVLPIFESRYVSPNYVLLGCGLSLVLYFALLPFIKSLALLLLTTAIASVFWAWMDVRANALLFAVWGEKVGPYLQALNFFFGVGGSTAPATIALVLRVCAPQNQLLFASFSLAFLALAASAMPALFPSPSTHNFSEKHHQHGKAGSVTLTKQQTTLLTFLTALFLFVYIGTQASYGGWIYTYARENFPSMPDWEAASLSSVFWIATTAGRFIAIPLSTLLSRRAVLLLDLTVCLPVGPMLILSHLVPVLQSKFVLWAATVIYGLGLASIYATAFSLPSESGVEVTHSTSSWFIVGGMCGDMAVPALLGFVLVRYSAVLAWAVLGSTIVLFILFNVIIRTMKHWADCAPLKEPTGPS